MPDNQRGKPFTKNDSRINRKGRPKKGAALTDVLNYKLDQKKDGRLRRETVAEKLIELAEGGDAAALRYLIDRIDGKPRETINANVTGEIISMDKVMKKLEGALLYDDGRV